MAKTFQPTPQVAKPSDIDRLIAVLERIAVALEQAVSALPKPLARG